MRRKICFLLVIAIALSVFSYASLFEGKTLAATTSSYSNIAKLLYVGLANTKTQDVYYPSYSTSDLTSIINSLGAKEYVITSGNNAYGFKQCVTLADINTITTVGSTAYNYAGTTNQTDLTTIKNEYTTAYNGIPATNTRDLETYADAQISLANSIWAIDSTAKVWFSFPMISAPTFAYKYNDAFKTKIVDRIKNSITSTRWTNNVLGFFYATEGIPQWYTKFVTTSTTEFNNPIVNNMNAVSTYVKSFSKKMLWIPYYRVEAAGSEVNLRLAYVTCRKNIFDNVDLQPGYYFNSSLTSNVNLVKTCVQNNTIVKSDGTATVTKTSTTAIGAEMEIDANVYSRYDSYVTAFSGFRGTKHLSFYAGTRNTIMNTTVFGKVQTFCTY